MGSTSSEGGIVTGSRFIIYAARAGAKSFFEGISDPTFFMTINKILDNSYYRQYEDPKHGEVFTFESLRDFVVHSEGLDIPDWLPFMKALQAQDDGSAAKKLYKRMLDLDNRLDPLVGSSSRVLRMPGHGEIGNGRKDKSRVDLIKSTQGGTGQAYLLQRLARDAPEVLERVKSGKIKSARAAAIEAGIITPFPSLQLKDPAPTAQKLLAKKGKAWCLQLLEELSGLLEEPVSE
jgi:hypothetical protein